MNIKKICIGHKPPDFCIPEDTIIACPFSLGLNNEIVISDERFGINKFGSSLAEYSQLFGLMDMIGSGDIVADQVYLFQYRKFITPVNVVYNSVASWVKVLSPKMAEGAFPSDEMLYSKLGSIVLGDLLDFGESIQDNYKRNHVGDDFSNFIAACARSELVLSTDLDLMNSMRGIIPSPALSFIPVEVLFSLIDVLKSVAFIFGDQYYVERRGYQSRSTGYLLERLHSVLLCNRLMSGLDEKMISWNRVVVNHELKSEG